MNNADKHIAHWSNADVQKYLNGELSAREMHDLEQLALDDPFLADALEGLQTQPHQTLQQDLADLRTRLDGRVIAKPATIPWRAIRVAAAVILLVGLGFMAFYTLLDKKQPESIAKAPATPANEPAAPPAASQPATANAAPPAKQDADSIHITTAVAANKTRRIVHPPAEAEAKAARSETATQTARPPTITQTDQPTIAAKQPAQPPPAAIADIAKDTIQFYASEERRPDSLDFKSEFRAGAVTVGANAHLLAFSGRVLDFNHRPLAGASLTYKNKGLVTGAVTDARGQFNLYIPQKDTARQLTVAMAGYQETQYALSVNEQSGNTIYLRQSPPELNEVVVSGIGAKRKEFMAEPPSDNPEKLDSFWLNTAPAMGRIAYLNYLSTAAKTLPVDTTIHGTESISFRVDKKGALTEFRIERSLSPAHDAGVIRLITEGPPWKMRHGRSARALVNVTF